MAKESESSQASAEPNTLTDQWGREQPYDASKYPDGSAAKEGKVTGPSGQGGMTPKSRPDYQDMWPANPPTSAHAAEKAKENEAISKGEVSSVNPNGTENQRAKKGKK